VKNPAPSFRLVVVLVLTASLSVTTLSAAVEKTHEGRFKDAIRFREGGVIAVAPRPVNDLESNDSLYQGWDEFRARHGGAWKIFLDERSAMPTLVSGRGVELFSKKAFEGATPDDVESRIRAFLQENSALLGDWTGTLELDAGASGELREGHWQLVFRQSVDGVRVESSRLDFHVVDGKLTLFGSSNWGPATVGGVPQIDAGDARDFLDAYLGVATKQYESVGEPELVMLALDADPGLDRPRKWSGPRGAGLTHALVWRLQFRDPESPAVWVGEIDAHDGSVRAFFDGAHYAAIRGGVIPEAPSVGCVSGSCEIAGFPMPFADWTESGQPTARTDAYGNLTCNDPEATFTTALNGQYARVQDNCGPVLETAGCGDALRLGTKAGENCNVAPGSSAGNTAAARSAYYHVNRVNEVARFYNPASSWLNGKVTINTNWNQTCNASYGGGGIYLYRSGTSWAECANSGEIQGIAVHEWGHGYDFNDGGGEDYTSEAYGDVVSMLASRESCFGPGLFTDGRVCSGYGDTCLTCTGFRDHDWAARQGNTPATPQDFVQNNCSEGAGPCGRSVHCESYPIGESIFDLATRDLPAAGMDVDSAWQLVERLWYSTRAGSGGSIYTCALPDSDSCAAGSWYQRLRVFDDDDGDLSNGTPHAAELYAAFARHNIACGAPEDAENQSTSGCPALAAPVLALGENVAGPALSWDEIPGAVEYLVYRGDLGCNRQQVAIATLPAGTTIYSDALPDPDIPRYYRVEAIGANAACRSAVSNCEISAGGPRLQKNDHRMIEEGANVNGNGFLDPGETVKLPVALFNGGTADALDVTGRLRTVDPTQGRVIEPVATYPDLVVGEESESNLPHFELTLFESGVACGESVMLELEMDALGAATRYRQFELTLGDRNRDLVKTDSIPIQRQTPTPVTTTLNVIEDRTIAELDVTVNISHPNVAELIVELTSPQNTTVRLHDNSGSGPGLTTRYDLEADPDGPGTMADFEGESILGNWTLSVRDTVWGAAGAAYLNGFTLHVTADGAFDCDVLTCPEPVPGEAPDGFFIKRVVDGGDGSIDLVFSWNGVAGAAGYHVLHSTVATYDSLVDVTGRTTGETTLTMENGAAITPDLTFFQVRAVNGCNEESP
jgi:subtilisin-like proprotein convertase family protein